MFIHPPAAVAGKTKYNALSRGAKIIMQYNDIKDALKELRIFTPEQASESLFKKGDIVTVQKGDFILVDTDEAKQNQAAAAKVSIKRGEETIERNVTLRTLFGTIRTDRPEKVTESNVDVILPYAKARYESRFVPDFNVADAIKRGGLEKDWTFEIEEREILVNQFVDRKNDDIDADLKTKSLNGQKYVNGLFRLKTVACSKRP